MLRTSNRRRSNYVDSICDGRRLTADLGQFITLSFHLCVQHDAHDAVRRTGPSATADTFIDDIVADAGNWHTDVAADDAAAADDDDIWADDGDDADGAAGGETIAGHDDTALSHYRRAADDSGVDRDEKDGSGNTRHAADTVRILAAAADTTGPEDDNHLGSSCITGGRRRNGRCDSDGPTNDAVRSRDGRPIGAVLSCGARGNGRQNTEYGSDNHNRPGGRTGRGHGDGRCGKNGVMGPGDVNSDRGQYGRSCNGTPDCSAACNDSGSVGGLRRENENSRRSRGDSVTGSGRLNSRVNSCDVDVSCNKDGGGHASGSRGDQSDDGDVGSGAAGAADICDDQGDASLSEDVQRQLAFVRQQRMKWLEARDHGATTESTAAKRSAGSSETKPDREISEMQLATSGKCLSVVSRQRDSVVPRPATEKSKIGRHAPASPQRPAPADSVGEDEEPAVNGGNGGKNSAHLNRVRNCSNSQVGSSAADISDSDGVCKLNGRSGGLKVTVFGTTNDDRPSTVAVGESFDDQKPRRTASSYFGTAERQRTQSESQHGQQRVPDAGASVSLQAAPDDDRRSLETQLEPASVDATDASICADPPVSEFRAPISTRNDVGILSIRRSAEMLRPSENAERKTADAVSPGLHDDEADSASGAGVRSLDVRCSFYPISLSLDMPVNEDDFDVYVNEDGLKFWLQGISAEGSFSAHNDFTGISPTEGFADSENTLLKLPVYLASKNASDKPEEVRLEAETEADYQSACELAQSVTLDTPSVESTASDVKVPYSCAKLWTCVYSREGVGVGEISARCSPVDCAEIRNNVLDDATTAVTLSEEIGVNDERASENRLVDEGVCCSPSIQDTVTESTYNAANQSPSKPEEVCLSAETRTNYQSANESTQSATLDTSTVEGSACDVKATPGCAKLRTCVYSRDGTGVGEVKTRLPPAFCDAEVHNNVLVDATVAVTLAEVTGVDDEWESEEAEKPVCFLPSFRNTVIQSTYNDANDANQTSSKETARCDKASHEVISLREQLTFVSTESCMKTTLPQNGHEESSDVVPVPNTTERESVVPNGNATNDTVREHSIDCLNSLVPVDELNKLSDADDSRLRDTNYEIPEEMEADFIDQMYHETCPNVSRGSTEDCSSETSLSIVVSHVVDDRHFWGQIVNEGIQVCAAIIRPHRTHGVQ